MLITKWDRCRLSAKTAKEKSAFNVWDNFMDDVLPTLKDALARRWSWCRNQKCKYITVRIDMRDGKCLISDRDGNRINPEDLMNQGEKD